MRCIQQLLVAALLALSFGTARAATELHFELGGVHSANFDILKAPTPGAVLLGDSFTVDGVAGVFDGIAGVRNVEFFNNTGSGGFAVLGVFTLTGPQLYLGPETHPQLLEGDYLLNDAAGATAGLVVFDTGAPGGVPEPATWTMLILGLGGVGATIRTRHRPVRAAVARLMSNATNAAAAGPVACRANSRKSRSL